MEMRKRGLRANHPSTLTSIANPNYTLKVLDREDEAIKLMSSCLKLRIQVIDPSHHRTQSVLEALMTWLSPGGVL